MQQSHGEVRKFTKGTENNQLQASVTAQFRRQQQKMQHHK